MSLQPLIVLMLTVATPVQDVERLSPEESYAQAEKKHQAGEVLAAEKLYRRALASSKLPHRLGSYDRLLVIYSILERPDQVIEVGLEYEKGLRELKQEQRLRELALQLGVAYFQLGHHGPAQKRLEEALTGNGLSAVEQLHAWVLRGRAAEARRDRAAADKAWGEVRERGERVLAQPPGQFALKDRVRCAWTLADAYRYKRQPAEGIAVLEKLLDALGQGERASRRDTLYRLAALRSTNKEHARAVTALGQALDVHRLADPEDKLIEADLLQAQADALEKDARFRDADEARARAVDRYTAVLKEESGGSVRAVRAFWRLAALHEKAGQFRQVAQLTASQGDVWDQTTPIHPRLIAEQGNVETIRGAYRKAHGPLRQAVEQLERQRPLNLFDLPRVLNNLALVELTRNRLDEAVKHARRVQALYAEHQLPDDGTLIDSHSVLGTAAVLDGAHADGLAHYRKGIALCEVIGHEADPERSHLQLKVALLLKSQGDVEGALAACATAHELYKGFSRPDALGHAWFRAAQGSMHAAQGSHRRAASCAPDVLDLCAKHGIEGGLLVVTAKHCQALGLLADGKAPEAEKVWAEVRAIQEKDKDELFLPRTLNYLGLAAEMQGRGAEAEKCYRLAVSTQEKNPRALPGIHFISRWRLANVLDRRGEKDRGREMLAAAVDVAEKARPRVYGDFKQRAAFYVQFSPAFDELVERCVRDGKPEEALKFAVRARSRGLLDQLLASGVDPRRDLSGADGAKLRRREQELRQEMSRIRAQAHIQLGDSLDEAALEKRREELAARLDRAEAAYAEVWREILNLDPVFRQLDTDTVTAESLTAVRSKALTTGSHLLFYWLGRRHSFVFLVGPKAIDVYPLTAPAALVQRVRELAGQKNLACPLPEREPLPTVDPGAAAMTPVPVGRALAWVMVELYRYNLADHLLGGTRSLRITRRGAAATTLEGEQVGLLFVPIGLRRRVAALALKQLIVVPDGALHRLPLEALIYQDGAEPRYLLDEWPPLVYAPSVPVLAVLLGRRDVKGGEAASLLTVGNVAFPKVQGSARAEGLEAPLGLLKELTQPLQHSRKECEQVAALFKPDQVKTLMGREATEPNLLAAVKGKRFVHLTTHGFAEDGKGNLFGGLVLSPPAKITTADDDGLLCLHETHRLDLSACELAVLSACWTNHGPQAPQEAGVTLACGFLGAGAHRVVATHWAVDDASSAELITAFFHEVIRETAKGTPYAVALHRARRQIRTDPKWQAPFHWAPFVLVGQP